MTEPTAPSTTESTTTERTPFEMCLQAFEGARDRNLANGQNALTAYFGARAWTVNKVAKQRELSPALTTELGASLSLFAPEPTEEGIRAHLDAGKTPFFRTHVRVLFQAAF